MMFCRIMFRNCCLITFFLEKDRRYSFLLFDIRVYMYIHIRVHCCLKLFLLAYIDLYLQVYYNIKVNRQSVHKCVNMFNINITGVVKHYLYRT